MPKPLCGIALAITAILAASPVFAGPLHFDFHDALGSDSFSFDLASATPTPDFSQPNYGTQFLVSGIVDGALDSFDVNFYNSNASGGLEADNLGSGGNFFFQNGFGQYNPVTMTYQQIYSGAENAPMFSPGEFILDSQDPATFESSGIPEGVLTVSAISAAPEPSTWALMFMGVGALGLMLRRRRSMAPLAAA